MNKNILINVESLRTAIYAINCAGYDVVIVASGSMYATLKWNEFYCKVLTENSIHWQFDN